MRALTAEQAREVEEQAVAEQGLTLAALMRSAGAAVARETAARVPEGAIVVLAGAGNNGGDGWIAALELNAVGRDVRVLSLLDPGALKGIAAEAAADAIRAGVRFSVPDSPLSADDLADAAIVVDALLGIGATGALREPLDAWVAAANACSGFVLAVDVPTGVDADTGAIASASVEADCTVTFTAIKRGLVLYPGAALCGDLVVADLGILGALSDVAAAPEVWTVDEYASLIPQPAPDTHKNARGRVLVVAGSSAYPGAAILAARGAMRTGAGYVTLAVPDAVVSVAQGHLVACPVVGLPQARTHTLSSAALDKVLSLACDYDAVVLGPGLTVANGAATVARGMVARINVPLVVDADGLNALVDARDLIERRAAPTVLTPHPGELAHLLGRRTSEVQSDRVSSSAELAGQHRAVVLKGAGTVTSCGGRQVINTSGSPALATAGTGDVLAGVIGALLAQGLEPLEAGALGAYLHGRAGEAAAAALTPVCVIAEDIPEFLPSAVAEVLTGW
jgi:ADP-dependent NAD(P)H-hydrate dehydratase / NAD(P)H-hydrate epimerase